MIDQSAAPPQMLARPHACAVRAAALLLMVPILLPCLVSISPVIYFDIDPRSDMAAAAITTVGPAGAAWLHVLSVAVAAIAMAASAWAGGRVRWGACLLFLLGAAAAASYLGGTFADRLQCGAWIAAASIGLAAAHLAQHEAARRWLIAAAIAIVLPLALQAAWYVLVEHPATVESYLRGEADLLRARGWVAGSPQHELYRRRLTDASAIGAFGLSNVLGSLAAALTLMSAAVALRLTPKPLPNPPSAADEPSASQPNRHASVVPAAATLLGALTLALTHSKGAMLAAAAGAALLALIHLTRHRPPLRRYLPWTAITLIALAAAAVLLRAAFGPPETWHGERSLLFRWHYWQGAARALIDQAPHSLITGIGPTGFHETYPQFKNPISPEDVTSTHNVFVDLVVMLGAGGLAWAAMLLGWLWCGGQALAQRHHQSPPPRPASPATALTRADIVPAAALAAILFATQYVIEFDKLVIESALIWLIGLLGFIAIAAVLHRALAATPRRALAAAFVAGAVLLIHNQIEMTFFHLPSTATAWGLVGLAAGAATAASPARPSPPPIRFLPAALLLAASVGFGWTYAAPIQAQQSRVAAAAHALQSHRVVDAAHQLDAAAAVIPVDSRILRWRVQLRLDVAYRLGRRGPGDVVRRILDETRDVIVHAREAGAAGPGPYRLLASVEEAAAQLLPDPDRRAAAADALRHVLALDPYNIRDHLHLADLLWQMHQRPQAAALYRRALKLSDLSYLDPATQLTPDQIDHIRQRLAAAQASAPPSPQHPPEP